MKKSKLIELLNTIDGDPEVVLWNGFVSDYQHISPELIEEYLTKPTFETYQLGWLNEKRRDANSWDVELNEDELKECRLRYNRSLNWEYNEFITTEDIKTKTYKKKRIVFLQPKLRGETYWDRLGDMSY